MAENLMVGSHGYSNREWSTNYDNIFKKTYICWNCMDVFVDQEVRKHKCPTCDDWLEILDTEELFAEENTAKN